MTYFKAFMTKKESQAWKQWSTAFKMGGNPYADRVKISLERGWLSEDSEILDLLKNGYNEFEINTAKRILQQNQDSVILNNCPKCGKLARTPNAKQCHNCKYDWH